MNKVDGHGTAPSVKTYSSCSIHALASCTSTARTMAAMRWLPFLCLAVAAAGSMLHQARAQADSKGFISIDCGYAGEMYIESDTRQQLQFAPDVGFTTAGSNHDISVEYMSTVAFKLFKTVRSFPDGKRNCYKIRSLVPGLKYLIRAWFLYGNYDGLNTTPIFDLYVGANFWTTMNMSRAAPDQFLFAEAMVVVPNDYVHVCLVNTGAGAPFITGLELRPLKSMLYPDVSAKQGLNLLSRLDLGTGSKTRVIRYPDDPHDRIWRPVDTTAEYPSITTFRRVENPNDDPFQVPTEVMESAITARNASALIEITMHPQPQPNNPSPGYIAILHIAELRILRGNAVRQFYVNLNSKQWSSDAITPKYLSSGAIYGPIVPDQQGTISISLEPTAGSTLLPILNAFEIFSVMPTTKVDAESEDGTPSPTPTTNAGSKDGNFGPNKSEDDVCIGGSSCKKSNKLVLYIAVPIAGLVVIGSAAVLIFCLLRRKKQGPR
ncbi:hypothetical protein ACQJBY_053417 [Aegilops geniculata]